MVVCHIMYYIELYYDCSVQHNHAAHFIFIKKAILTYFQLNMYIFSSITDTIRNLWIDAMETPVLSIPVVIFPQRGASVPKGPPIMEPTLRPV